MIRMMYVCYVQDYIFASNKTDVEDFVVTHKVRLNGKRLESAQQGECSSTLWTAPLIAFILHFVIFVDFIAEAAAMRRVTRAYLISSPVFFSSTSLSVLIF